MRFGSEFFIKNREGLRNKAGKNAVIIITSNVLYPTNADGTFPYKQNNNLWYFTGIAQEESVLVMHLMEEKFQEVLYIKEPDDVKEKWVGRFLKINDAKAISGIQQIKYIHELQDDLLETLPKASEVYVDLDEHDRREAIYNPFALDIQDWITGEFEHLLHGQYSREIHRLRSIKKPEEIACIEDAVKLTYNAMEAMKPYIKSGNKEYEVTAAMEYHIKNQGAQWADYHPIFASGKDSCILHYHENNKILKAGELLLVDAAASINGYNADITRVFPIEFSFNQRQKAVYDKVKEIQNYIMQELRPGVLLSEVFKLAKFKTFEVLIELGLGEMNVDYEVVENRLKLVERYSYHHPCHFLGLDVHDYGLFDEPLAVGMVLTNEPGIYIEDESIGIRLENNVLIGATENRVLGGEMHYY